MCLRECWCTNKAGSFFCIIGHFLDLKCLSVHLFFCLLSVHTERLTVGMLYTETIMNPWYLTRPVFGIIVSHSFYVSHEWVRNSNQYYWYTYDYSNDWSRSVEDASLILKCKFRKSVYEPRMKACTVYHKKRWFYLYEIFQVFSICKDFLNFNCLHLWTEKWMVACRSLSPGVRIRGVSWQMNNTAIHSVALRMTVSEERVPFSPVWLILYRGRNGN